MAVNIQAWRVRINRPIEIGHPYYPQELPWWKIGIPIALMLVAIVGVCSIVDIIIGGF